MDGVGGWKGDRRTVTWRGKFSRPPQSADLAVSAGLINPEGNGGRIVQQHIVPGCAIRWGGGAVVHIARRCHHFSRGVGSGGPAPAAIYSGSFTLDWF